MRFRVGNLEVPQPLTAGNGEKEKKMKTRGVVLGILLLFLVPLAASANDTAVVELVDKGIGFWKEKGKDYTIKLLNASSGPLRKGALYVFACDFKGYFVSHPVQDALRGQDAWELQDAKGKFIVQEFIKVAKQGDGAGWVEYDWLRVGENEPTKKRTFIRRVPGENFLLGCGYYMQSH
jgi:signal transduction histidine kinase